MDGLRGGRRGRGPVILSGWPRRLALAERVAFLGEIDEDLTEANRGARRGPLLVRPGWQAGSNPLCLAPGGKNVSNK